jgi:hypothetical protein
MPEGARELSRGLPRRWRVPTEDSGLGNRHRNPFSFIGARSPRLLPIASLRKPEHTRHERILITGSLSLDPPRSRAKTGLRAQEQRAAFGRTKIQGKSLLVCALNALASAISTPAGALVIAATGGIVL